jgi:hypothetical protein
VIRAQKEFSVIAFYTAKNDKAHISFVHEANRWFPIMAKQYHFTYDSTNDWTKMTDSFLARYQVVVFLDTRPDDSAQRAAFERYMRHGGAWMGFHFSAFALTPSEFPQNWDWYHNEFLGSGSYVSNTWHPTSAVLRVEDPHHPAVRHMPATFSTAPNEWYRWSNDLRSNPDIDILLTIDSSSFPLGTGPKESEIWQGGYYPVAWSNKKYHMIYFNMGHNDIDYDHHTDKELSLTFRNKMVEKLVMESLRWLGRGK